MVGQVPEGMVIDASTSPEGFDRYWVGVTSGDHFATTQIATDEMQSGMPYLRGRPATDGELDAWRYAECV